VQIRIGRAAAFYLAVTPNLFAGRLWTLACDRPALPAFVGSLLPRCSSVAQLGVESPLLFGLAGRHAGFGFLSDEHPFLVTVRPERKPYKG